MLKQTREKDLAVFVDLAGLPQPGGPDDIPTYVIMPAFMVSELKTAFQMGFVIFIPFWSSTCLWQVFLCRWGG